MRKIIIAVLAAAFLLLGTVSAHADDHYEVQVTSQIVDSPDNDCPAWARDTFARTTTLTKVDEGVYDVRFDGIGTFTAASGITGSLVEVIEYQVYGTLSDDISSETVDFSGVACKGDSPELDKTSKFALRYFEDGAEAKPITNWSYVYDTGCESFTEDASSEAVGADTFVGICAVPEEPTLTQPTCEVPEPEVTLPETDGVVYEVKGDVTPGHDAKVVATPDEGYIFEGEQKVFFKLAVAAVPGCPGDDGSDGQDGNDGTSNDDDDPVAVPTAVPAGAELPKTGVGAPLGIGLGLLTIGGGLLAARRFLTN